MFAYTLFAVSFIKNSMKDASGNPLTKIAHTIKNILWKLLSCFEGGLSFQFIIYNGALQKVRCVAFSGGAHFIKRFMNVEEATEVCKYCTVYRFVVSVHSRGRTVWRVFVCRSNLRFYKLDACFSYLMYFFNKYAEILI